MARDNSRKLLMKDWGWPFESCYPTSNVAADENDVDYLQPKEIGFLFCNNTLRNVTSTRTVTSNGLQANVRHFVPPE